MVASSGRRCLRPLYPKSFRRCLRRSLRGYVSGDLSLGGCCWKCLRPAFLPKCNGRSRESIPSSPAVSNPNLILLQLLEKLTCRAGDINPSRYAALSIFHAFDNARCLAALGTISALAGVHNFFTVCRFCNFRSNCHDSFLLMSITQRIPLLTSCANNCGWVASNALSPQKSWIRPEDSHAASRLSSVAFDFTVRLWRLSRSEPHAADCGTVAEDGIVHHSSCQEPSR